MMAPVGGRHGPAEARAAVGSRAIVVPQEMHGHAH
jgi:hypothetical protein